MTDSTPTSPRGTDAQGDHLTVEDAGSTTDPTDLANGASSGAQTGTGTGTHRDGLAALSGDDSIGHVFDQTNGVIEGVDGDSDGTADSDLRSAAERHEGRPGVFHRAERRGDGDEEDVNRTGA